MRFDELEDLRPGTPILVDFGLDRAVPAAFVDLVRKSDRGRPGKWRVVFEYCSSRSSQTIRSTAAIDKVLRLIRRRPSQVKPRERAVRE